MDDIALTPVALERRIVEISNRIAKSAGVCNERYVEFLDADRVFDAAFARAYLAHEGPQSEKRYAADLLTVGEREARDTADAAYRYADRLSRALQAELMALQSLNKSVLATYGAAGHQ